MRRFVDYFLSAAVFATLGSCSIDSVPVTPMPNPMEHIWAGIGSKIVHLEESHATVDEWTKAAGEVTRIRNAEELRGSLRYTELSSEEMDRALAEFSSATRTIHFGFDCNYHALVFFGKNNRSSYVIRW